MEEHLSLKCRVCGLVPHVPCSGGCDAHGTEDACLEPCSCWCHATPSAWLVGYVEEL